jgi:hypothetical protein
LDTQKILDHWRERQYRYAESKGNPETPPEIGYHVGMMAAVITVTAAVAMLFGIVFPTAG